MWKMEVLRKICFNPTLVRLRLMLKKKVDLGYPLFQSHAGSIEAQSRGTRTKKTLMFQSHAGSIEAIPNRRCEMKRITVSIPRWFD